jgi:hypothetical protein
MGPQGPQGPQGAYYVDFSNIADLCGIMPRRLLTTGILIQWLRWHFTWPDNIENPFLKDQLWTPDLETSAIAIDSVFKYNPANTEQRPAIFVKPGPWKILRYGIDDRKMVGTLPDGMKPPTYNTMIQGSHTIFCIAGESAEVENLANEVYHELMEFGPVARRVFNFLRFVVTDVGEPAILEEATENFVVPITVSYGAQDVWQICAVPPELLNLDERLWKKKKN